MVTMVVSGTIGGTFTPGPPPPGTVGTYTYGPSSGPNDIDFFYAPGGFISLGAPTAAQITGTFYNWNSSFGNAPAFSVIDDTHIRIFMNVGAPEFSTQDFSIQVTLGDSSTITSDVIHGVGNIPALAYTPPLNPATGSAGDEIVITGEGFTLVTKVRFSNPSGSPLSGPLAVFVIDSDTQIRATVPSGTLGVGPILLDSVYPTEPGSGAKVLSSDSFYPQGPPVEITSFSPGSGAPGTVVTIIGSGFTGNTTLDVYFTGYTTPPPSVQPNVIAPTYTIVDDNTIQVTVPEGATVSGQWVSVYTGPIKIVTTGPDGSYTSAADFTPTLPTATVTGFSPTRGNAGDTIAITGTNLLHASGVLFNGLAAASFTYVDQSNMTAVVPAGGLEVGKGPITVQSINGGSDTSVDDFTFNLNSLSAQAEPFPVDFPATNALGAQAEPILDFPATNALSAQAEPILDFAKTNALGASAEFTLVFLTYQFDALLLAGD
jgi:hypothetical protein